VAALFDICPVSAITISLVRDHLRRFRDDLIEEKHLVASAQPFGVFLPVDEVRTSLRKILSSSSFLLLLF